MDPSHIFPTLLFPQFWNAVFHDFLSSKMFFGFPCCISFSSRSSSTNYFLRILHTLLKALALHQGLLYFGHRFQFTARSVDGSRKYSYIRDVAAVGRGGLDCRNHDLIYRLLPVPSVPRYILRWFQQDHLCSIWRQTRNQYWELHLAKERFFGYVGRNAPAYLLFILST